MSADGNWKITINSPMGAQEVNATITTNGGTFTGNTSGRMGEQAIEGKVDGDKLTWSTSITSPMPMTLEFEATVSGDLFGLYEMLREASPAPMAAYLKLDGREILSSSPESFLKISGRGIETRPIKGTRPRQSTPDADAAMARELLASDIRRWGDVIQRAKIPMQ